MTQGSFAMDSAIALIDLQHLLALPGAEPEAHSVSHKMAPANAELESQ